MEILCGYTFPALWTLITAIVNHFGDECDSTYPRIAPGVCSFSTQYGKLTHMYIIYPYFYFISRQIFFQGFSNEDTFWAHIL